MYCALLASQWKEESQLYLSGGDFNCNLLKYHEQSNVTNLVDSLASCGCISFINKPTRFRKNCTPSLLDHIYTNTCDEKKNNAGITIYDISDHLPVFLNLRLHNPIQLKIQPKIRCMKHFYPNTFLTDLSHNLNNVNPEAGEVNTLSDKFVKDFNGTLDKHAPYRYVSRKEQRSFNKPWLTKGILTSIAKKNTLYRKQLTTNNTNIIRQYKTYRNKLTHLKEISKQNYYKQAFQKFHHDKNNMEACQWNDCNKKQISTK